MKGGRRRGDALIVVLTMLGAAGVVFGAFFSQLSAQLRLVDLSVARMQALYLAEAGLEVMCDRLNTQWEPPTTDAAHALHEALSMPSEAGDQPVGHYTVVLRALGTDALEVRSTGRTAGGAERTLAMTVIVKRSAAFRRIGMPGELEVDADYFDEDSLPDVLRTSGAFQAQGPLGTEGILSAGTPEALATGYHVVASFADVDADDDLDLLLTSAFPVEGAHNTFMPAQTLSEEARETRPSTMTTADFFHTGKPIPFTAPGWVFLPQGALASTDPGVDVLVNEPVYRGVRRLTWHEVQGAP